MKIGPNDLVLDVGSGHNPNPRSDILCDRYIEDDTERGGSIRVDRPLIVADAHNLPFKTGAFDYVIASHIIEHMDDPLRVLLGASEGIAAWLYRLAHRAGRAYVLLDIP